MAYNVIILEIKLGTKFMPNSSLKPSNSVKRITTLSSPLRQSPEESKALITLKIQHTRPFYKPCNTV